MCHHHRRRRREEAAVFVCREIFDTDDFGRRRRRFICTEISDINRDC